MSSLRDQTLGVSIAYVLTGRASLVEPAQTEILRRMSEMVIDVPGCLDAIAVLPHQIWETKVAWPALRSMLGVAVDKTVRARALHLVGPTFAASADGAAALLGIAQSSTLERCVRVKALEKAQWPMSADFVRAACDILSAEGASPLPQSTLETDQFMPLVRYVVAACKADTTRELAYRAVRAAYAGAKWTPDIAKLLSGALTLNDQVEVVLDHPGEHHQDLCLMRITHDHEEGDVDPATKALLRRIADDPKCIVSVRCLALLICIRLDGVTEGLAQTALSILSIATPIGGKLLQTLDAAAKSGNTHVSAALFTLWRDRSEVRSQLDPIVPAAARAAHYAGIALNDREENDLRMRAIPGLGLFWGEAVAREAIATLATHRTLPAKYRDRAIRVWREKAPTDPDLVAACVSRSNSLEARADEIKDVVYEDVRAWLDVLKTAAEAGSETALAALIALGQESGVAETLRHPALAAIPQGKRAEMDWTKVLKLIGDATGNQFHQTYWAGEVPGPVWGTPDGKKALCSLMPRCEELLSGRLQKILAVVPVAVWQTDEGVAALIAVLGKPQKQLQASDGIALKTQVIELLIPAGNRDDVMLAVGRLAHNNPPASTQVRSAAVDWLGARAVESDEALNSLLSVPDSPPGDRGMVHVAAINAVPPGRVRKAFSRLTVIASDPRRPLEVRKAVLARLGSSPVPDERLTSWLSELGK